MIRRTLTVDLPDIWNLDDDGLAELAKMRDGRWSGQTKELLKRFGTDRLDLNRAWAGTWVGWSCPCCRRDKKSIARLTSSKVLLCRLETHHDHIRERAERIYERLMPTTAAEPTAAIQLSRLKDALMLFVERFERVLVCHDCNLAEGQAKLALAQEIDHDFTFTPTEIAGFIHCEGNSAHRLDVDAARSAWLNARENFEDRLDFAYRMATRVSQGRHGREPALGQQAEIWLDDRTLIWRALADAHPELHDREMSSALVARSVSNDGAGASTKPKGKLSVSKPSADEFAVIDAANQQQKWWPLAGDGWHCRCCGRTKPEICRRSRRGQWTARIHQLQDWKSEQHAESLAWRGKTARSSLIIGSNHPVLVCQDCRNVVGESLRRAPGLDEHWFTIEDIAASIISIASNRDHEVDYIEAIRRASGNSELRQAVTDYFKHRDLAIRTRERHEQMMTSLRWTWDEARDQIGYDYAKTGELELDIGHGYVDWLLLEAERLV